MELKKGDVDIPERHFQDAGFCTLDNLNYTYLFFSLTVISDDWELFELTWSVSWATFSLSSSLTLRSDSSISRIRSSIILIFLSLSSWWEDSEGCKQMAASVMRKYKFSDVNLRKIKRHADYILMSSKLYFTLNSSLNDLWYIFKKERTMH